jgi:hypothetical protein
MLTEKLDKNKTPLMVGLAIFFLGASNDLTKFAAEETPNKKHRQTPGVRHDTSLANQSSVINIKTRKLCNLAV